MAVGSLAGALLAARRVRVRLRLLVLAATGFAAASIVASVLPTFVAFACFAPVIGICTITLLNSANATMQLSAAPELRGRVMALYMTVVMGGTPLGSPIIGAIGEHLGARWCLAVGGALTLVGVVVAVLVYTRLTGGPRRLWEVLRSERAAPDRVRRPVDRPTAQVR
jgi:MFS family permease